MSFKSIIPIKIISNKDADSIIIAADKAVHVDKFDITSEIGSCKVNVEFTIYSKKLGLIKNVEIK